MFRILKKDPASRARVGLIETPHGIVETPAYVVVGTHAKVRTLEPQDIIDSKTQLIIANTYHLWQALGEEGLKKFPGLHQVMGWQGPLMTDSGGFQVFSFGAAREHATSKVAAFIDAKPINEYSDILQHVGSEPQKSNRENSLVRITEDGVMFTPLEARSIKRGTAAAKGGLPLTGFTAGGKRHWLDAEKSIRIQQQLGADMIFAFDEPSSPHHDYAYTQAAMERTHRWAERSLKARTSGQMLYGIVQGGPYEDLRRQSARVIAGMPFDGIAIGGSYSNSFGDTREQTLREVGWATPFLPEDKPRHLLGIGLVEDLFACVAAGMDTFDCVVPTREARHGSIWTRQGRIDIKRGMWRENSEILDEECACPVCAIMQVRKADLWALFKDKNPEAGLPAQAGRLATLHNVFFFNDLMHRIREAIKSDTFAALRAEYIG